MVEQIFVSAGSIQPILTPHRTCICIASPTNEAELAHSPQWTHSSKMSRWAIPEGIDYRAAEQISTSAPNPCTKGQSPLHIRPLTPVHPLRAVQHRLHCNPTHHLREDARIPIVRDPQIDFCKVMVRLHDSQIEQPGEQLPLILV